MPAGATTLAKVVSREHGVLAGIPVAEWVLDEVVGENADAPARAGLKLLQSCREVIEPLEVLHHHSLDAQVVAPDLFDELGVVAALDEDPGPDGDPGLGVVHGDGPARGAGGLLLGGCEGGALGPLRRGERDRGAVDEEAWTEREGLDLAAPVLEVDDVDAAGLLHRDHGADPAGLDVLDDGAGHRLEGAGGGPRQPPLRLPAGGEDVLAVSIAHAGTVGRRAVAGAGGTPDSGECPPRS